MKIYCFALLLFTLAISSCSKKTDTSQVKNDPSIITEGDLAVYSSIQFKTDLPGTTAVAWDFGDSSSSTQFEPAHEYLLDGNYDVTLTANGKSIHKAITITLGEQRLKKSRSWHKKLVRQTGGGTNYTISEIDTEMALNMPDPDTIVLPQETLIPMAIHKAVKNKPFAGNILWYTTDQNVHAELKYFMDRDSISVFRVSSDPATNSMLFCYMHTN